MNTTKYRRSRPSNNAVRRRSFSNTKPKRNTFHGNDRRHGGSRSPHGPRHPSGGRRGGRKMPTFDPTQFINRNPVEVIEEAYTPKHHFGSFGLNQNLVKRLTNLRLLTPSPIQDMAIPAILEGKDVIGLAETGTGKTAAFLLPLIHKTMKEYGRQTLILAPTRELAIQIEEELRKLTRNTKIFSVICVGGVNIGPQIRTLKRRNHFVIGTPGRVLDLIKRKDFRPGNVTTVVLDEADRMLDMGFINDMRTILSLTREDRETLFFSATMTKDA